MSMAHTLSASWILIAAITVSGCANQPAEPFVRDEMQQVSATVEAIDPENRMVMLQGPNGPATIIAGPEVRNFDQIEVGDEVAVTYYEGMAAQINRSSKGVLPAEAPQEAIESVTAAPGEKPAGAVGRSVMTTVKIESVDTSFNTVTFRRPDGFVRTIAVETEEGRNFIRTLKPGDLVDVTYTEAVAVAVVPGETSLR